MAYSFARSTKIFIMSVARSANDSGSPINVPGQTERAPQTSPAMDASGAISITENTRFLVSNTHALNPE
jgi:hypothetical protein